MLKGVRGSKQALIRRFQLGERLAVRAAALQSKRVDMTGAVLESARPGSAVEKLLLHSQVLSHATGLSTEILAGLAETLPDEDLPPLAVHVSEEWRTIALEEETLAAQSDEAIAEDEVEEDAAARLPARLDPFQLVGREEMQELFTADKITGLKVTLLTSADVNEKISALRKLLLSPASARQKGAILIAALGDASPEVRAEAAVGLTRLGLNAGIAEAAQALAVGTLDQREFAAGELGRLVSSVQAAEIPILLTVVGSSLDSEQEERVRRALIAAARQAVPFVGKTPEHARELARLLARQARRAGQGLWPEIRSTVGELGAMSPESVGALVQEEVNNAPEGAVRRFLLTLFADFPLPEDMQEALSEQIAAEVARGSATEREVQNFANQLAAVGQAAVGPLCEAFEKAPEERRPALGRMIDIVCARREVPAEMKERAGALFARALKTADRHLRSTLLETALPTDRDLSEEVRSRLAEEFLGSLREFRHPRIAAEVEAKVALMGAAALKPLLKCLQDFTREGDALSAARSLGMLSARLEEGNAAIESQVSEAIDAALKAAARSSAKTRAELIRCVGRIAGAAAVPPSRAERLAAKLKGQLRETDSPYAILDALGLIAVHPHAPLQLQVETAKTFVGLLQDELPELLTEGQPADQEVFRLGSEVSAYTEMIPTLLRGLREIYHHTGSSALRERIVQVLLDRWREASEWRLLWGPGNSTLLLAALGAIGSDSSTPGAARLAIMDALAPRLEFPPAVRAIGEICRQQPAGRRLGDRAGRVAKLLLSRLGRRAALADDEADTAYEALGKIGGREVLGTSEAQGEEIREHVLGALFEGLREGYPGAAAGVRAMADSGTLSADVEQDARERLEDFGRRRRR